MSFMISPSASFCRCPASLSYVSRNELFYYPAKYILRTMEVAIFLVIHSLIKYCEIFYFDR